MAHLQNPALADEQCYHSLSNLKNRPLQNLFSKPLVANAGKIALIAKTRVKTDELDVLKLARLSVANLIPEVWVPPLAVRELRDLIAHRQQLTRMHTMIANRLQSLLHRYHFVPPTGEVFWESHRAWWEGLAVWATERLRLRQDLATLDHLRPQLAEVDAALARLSTVAPWAEAVPLLMQLPGFGLLTSLTVLGAVGDTLAPRLCILDTPAREAGEQGAAQVQHSIERKSRYSLAGTETHSIDLAG